MKISKIDFAGSKKVFKKKRSEEKKKLLEAKDSVSITGAPLKEDFFKNPSEKLKGQLIISSKENPSPTEKKSSNLKVPLTITLDIDGKTAEKTIMGSSTGKEVTLEMKHSNDIHGNMPHFATMIKPEEFWVDAGDTWQNYTFNSILSGGRKEVDMMNQRDCDLAVPGNHFYDDAGKKGGDMLVERANFPYISSNVKGMMPYTIAEVEGIKMAFIGVRTPRKRFSMVDPSLVKDLEIGNPLDAVKKSVEEVRAKGVKNVIVLSHLGLEPNEAHPNIISDKLIAKEIPGIDLIIGGHTHTPTPEEVVVNGTRIVQAGIDSHSDVKTDNLYLGELSLKFDKSSQKLTSIKHRLIPVDRESPLDKDVREINDRYLQEVENTLSEKLGKATGTFIHEVKTPVDSTLGNLMTDAMKEATGADIALLDSNFFSERGKAGSPKVLPEGDISMKDLTETSLWIGKSLDLKLETWEISGETLKKVLEEGISDLVSPKETAGLYQVSGLTMSYNPNKSEGERITSISVGNKPFDNKKNYKITTTYYSGNWDSILSQRDEEKVVDGRKLRHILSDYIKKEGSITPVQDKRISVSYD